MKRLFVIGNGFEIHHDLPTRYKNFRDYVKNLNFEVLDDRVNFTFEAPELADEQVVLYVNYNGTVLDPQFITIDSEGKYNGVLTRTEQSQMYEVVIYNKFLSSEPDTLFEVIDYPIAFTSVYRIYI